MKYFGMAWYGIVSRCAVLWQYGSGTWDDTEWYHGGILVDAADFVGRAQNLVRGVGPALLTSPAIRTARTEKSATAHGFSMRVLLFFCWSAKLGAGCRTPLIGVDVSYHT